MKKIMLILIVFMITLLCSCDFPTKEVMPSGNDITETIMAENLREIEINHIYIKTDGSYVPIPVRFYHSEDAKAKIFCNESILDDLKVSFKNGKLSIIGNRRKRYIVDLFAIHIYGNVIEKIDLQSVNIESIENVFASEVKIEMSGASKGRIRTTGVKNIKLDLSGASRLDVEPMDSMSDFDIDLSGASRIDIPTLNCETLKGDISGASKLDIESCAISKNVDIEVSGASTILMVGNTADIDLKLSGASSFENTGFTSDIAKVVLSGASSAKLVVNRELDYNLSGASRLLYSGNAVISKEEKSGGSSVEKYEITNDES